MTLSELRDGKCAKIESKAAFEKTYDIVVAGLGTAGALAALSAAENGASVLGVERLNECGGTGTAGGVFGYYYGLRGGRFEEIDAQAGKLRDSSFIPNGGFHPDAKAVALEQELLSKGVSILYESSVSGVYLSADGDICGVRLSAPDGTLNVGCKILIDASGDGEVCAAAGASFKEGRDFDGQPQPYSSVRVFLKDGRLEMANFDAGYAVSSDAADMTRGVIHGNALHLAEPGAQSCKLLWISTIPGLREGRLIDCDKTLSFASFMNGEFDADPVVWAYSNFDSHTQDWAFEDEQAKDWMVAASLWGKVFAIPIPLEATLVKGFRNLMAVGRCLSVDHIMACAVRMQRCLQKLGEAAGAAAALALRDGVELRRVDRKALRRLLEASGCLDAKLPDCSFPEEAARLKELLSGKTPGEAIWSLARNPEAYGAQPLEWLKGPDLNLARNCALALGIAGRKEALPALLEILRERDGFIPSSSSSHNQPRLLGAIHLLGKLKDAGSVGPLLSFAESESLDVQTLSHALIALLKLGESLPEHRRQIAGRLEPLLAKGSLPCELVLKNASQNGQKIAEPLLGIMRLGAARAFKSWGIESKLPSLAAKGGLSWRERRMIKELTA